MLATLQGYWDIIKENKYVRKFVDNKYAFYGFIGYTGYFVGSLALVRILQGIKSYNAYTTANYILKDKDFTGKTVLMTGGSAGLGKEACKLLVGKGATVYLAVRNIEKAKNAKNDIINTLSQSGVNVMDDAITLLKMDLNSLQSVYDCAHNILEQTIKVDYLINNAGVMAIPKYSETIDGYEKQFGINHLGHYYFTKLLMPLLIENKTRIINISSSANMMSNYKQNVPLLQYAYENKKFMGDYKNKYSAWGNYGISKACNIIHARALNKQYRKDGIFALALHPGSIVTELQREVSVIPGIGLPLAYVPAFFIVPWWVSMEVKGLQRGLSTLMRCITISNTDIQKSLYIFYYDCNPVPPYALGLAKYEDNDNMVDKLCDVSDVLITNKGFPLKIET